MIRKILPIILVFTCAMPIAAQKSKTTATVPALSLKLSPWALKAMKAWNTSSVVSVEKPTEVAGVRGRKYSADELYWKTIGLSVEARLLLAQKSQKREAYKRAIILNQQVLALSPTGRIADLAFLGIATSRLALGKADLAISTLKRIRARNQAEEIQIASTIPYAVALASTGRKEEARFVLEGFLEAYPEDPSARQVSGVLWILEE